VPTSTPFVYTKPGAFETGEGLSNIIVRKEAERVANSNVFWWGVGNSLGSRLAETARVAGGTLPLLFLVPISPTPASPEDTNPEFEFHWTKWQDFDGALKTVPPAVRVISRGNDEKRKHYALVCRSETSLKFAPSGTMFDLQLCRTANDKAPGSSQVTALVWGDSDGGHSNGKYQIAFRATLVYPWQATLVAHNRRRLR
jgi:hypothetical protein